MKLCKHILVVEDEPDIRGTIKDILEMEGFEVSTAENGREALTFFEGGQRSCLILLDLMMPVMDGWQFLQQLKDQHQHILATIPIVVVSAAADVATVEKEYGCRIMKKPFDLSTLIAIAREYCEQC